MLRRAAILVLIPLAACGTPPPQQQPVTLPGSAMPQGLSDPTRGAILSASFVYARPGTIAGDPAAGAEALAQLEFLTVQLATDQRWIGLSPSVQLLLLQGREEARAAFGIPQGVPPQAAVDALYGAAAALRAADRGAAAAQPGKLVGAARAEPMLAQLAAFPSLPRAAFALAQARNGMNRMDQGDRRGPWWF
jgi:hypothetical protein